MILEHAEVTVKVDGADHLFGCDKNTREQIKNTLIMIATGLNPPNQWTPKGMRHPISITPDELKNVGQAIMDMEDFIIKTYLTHKATIIVASPTQLRLYDFKTGYPADAMPKRWINKKVK
jgi:hypothetical protein